MKCIVITQLNTHTFHNATVLTLYLTLFEMGDHDGPQNVFDHCAQTLRRRKVKLCDFNINLWSIKKVTVWFPRSSSVTIATSLYREYSRFFEVFVPYVSL